MKVLTVVGARPNFVKVTLLSKELRKISKEILVHTGQHYDYEMSKVFFDKLSIPEPDYNLEVNEGNEVLQIAKMLIKLEEVMLKEKPDVVILIGDTNSTFAAAITASKLNLRCVHVEAGTRMHDKSIPEEINRIFADNVSELLFCPSKLAVRNLLKEGFTKGVHFTGDVMLDTLNHFLKTAEEESRILETLKVEKKGYILATVHRQINTNEKDNLSNIFRALMDSGEKVVVPLHPRTKKYLGKYDLLGKVGLKLIVIDPAKYVDMLVLEKNAKKIVTDSGGVQKEAYYLKTPCITLDSSTAWQETVDDGWNCLVGQDKDKIIDAIKNFNPTVKRKEYYGQGDAVKKIVSLIKELK